MTTKVFLDPDKVSDLEPREGWDVMATRSCSPGSPFRTQ